MSTLENSDRWRLPEFWEWATLSDAAELIFGQSPPSETYNKRGDGLPFFQGKAEFSGLHPAISKFCTAPSRLAQPGDILISIRAPVGPTNVADRACGIGRGLTAIRVKSGVDASYLRHFLRYTEASLADKGTGTTFSAITKPVLSRHAIALAPSGEQRRIASKIDQLFSQIEAGDTALQHAQALLERYRKSVLTAAVTGELTRDWREKNRDDIEPADKLLQRILTARRGALRASNGRTAYNEPCPPDVGGLHDLPEGWNWVTLETVAHVKGGITVDAKRKPAAPVTVPYLRVANVQRGYLDLSDVKQIIVEETKISELLLRDGDILLNEGGDLDKLGRGSVWHDEISPCTHQNHVFRARLFNPDCIPELVSWHANTLGSDFFIEQGKHTTNLASISLSKLRRLPVPLIPLAEQREIYRRVQLKIGQAMDALAGLEELRRNSDLLRRSVLKTAFEGRLVPQDANDEPASVLLARIRERKSAASAKNIIAGRKRAPRSRKDIHAT